MKLEKNYPLVSCLCIVRNEFNIVKRAIDCFRAQTYPNKEIILLKNGEVDELKIRTYLKKLNEDNIFFVEPKLKAGYTLGDLRNIAIKYAKGKYLCQWDDTDWHHAERISIQVNAAINNYNPASQLMNYIIYDSCSQKAWLSVFKNWENTLLFERQLLDKEIKYPSLDKNEDTVFMNLLLLKSRLYPVVSPNLFICTYSGSSPLDKDDFETMVSFSQKLPENASVLVNNIMSGKYSVAEASDHLNSHDFLKELNHYDEKRKTLAKYKDENKRQNKNIEQLYAAIYLQKKEKSRRISSK